MMTMAIVNATKRGDLIESSNHVNILDIAYGEVSAISLLRISAILRGSLQSFSDDIFTK